jgi:predicted PurR-regulated permease PerM
MAQQRPWYWIYGLRLLGGAIAIYLVFRLQQTLQLLLTSLFFAGAITPLVERMVRWRVTFSQWHLGLNRTAAIAMIYTVLAFAILVAIAPAPRLVSELGQFFTQLPILVQKLELPSTPVFGISPQLLREVIETRLLLEQVQTLGREIAGQTVDITVRILSTLGVGLLSLMITAYMVINADPLLDRLLAPLSTPVQTRIRQLLPPITNCLGAYVLGRLGTSFLLGLCTYFTLSLIGVSFAAPLGLVTAIANLVPYLGGLMSLILITITASSLSLSQVFLAAGICFALQQIEAWILQPWLVAPYLNLDPFELLLSIIIGAELLGVPGAILAPPIAGVGRILIRQLSQPSPAPEDPTTPKH